MESQKFWFLRDPYAWIVLVLGVITAVVINQAWVVLLGLIGYLIALLVEITRGRSLGRSGAIRLARAEQEVRELQAERARLLGAIAEQQEKLKSKGAPQGEGPALASDGPPHQRSEPEPAEPE